MISELIQRFCDHLRAVDPRNTCDGEDGVFTVYFQGADDRAEFVVTDEVLRERMSAMEQTKELLWPDASVELATFRILSIHFEEQIAVGNLSREDLPSGKVARYMVTPDGFTEMPTQ